jgi:hypothetical protein
MANIACQYGIPVGLFDAMIIRESRYNAAIYSPKNAFGLTQLMPDTAAGLGVNRYDVEQALATCASSSTGSASITSRWRPITRVPVACATARFRPSQRRRRTSPTSS